MTFRAVAREKVHDAHLQAALDVATARLRDGRLAAWSALDDVEELRTRAHDAKMRIVEDLDAHVARFRDAAEAAGVQTFFARTAAEANAYVLDVCRRRGAKLVAKSKSMLTEEIGLNAVLEADGVRVVETDLGEYILQLAGEHPVHIVAPAIEKTAAQVAELFGVESTELEALTAEARARLRETFLTADVGVTGANFGVCETGSICLVTNEGNGRLVSSLPPVHVAVMGVERLVEGLDDLSVLLRLLARSGTGQRLTTYTTLITGPRQEGETDGPEELHVVIVDNGRSRLAGGRYREMLACIRCGACLNVCPVYRKTGGAAYSDVYCGPMGAVLVPLLSGLPQNSQLPHASSLCGACSEACPVKIPLPELLLELRRDLVGQGVVSRSERLLFWLWSVAWSSPLGYRLSARVARVALPLAQRLWPGRTLPRPRRLYRERR